MERTMKEYHMEQHNSESESEFSDRNSQEMRKSQTKHGGDSAAASR
jgi:hypothetical protein